MSRCGFCAAGAGLLLLIGPASYPQDFGWTEDDADSGTEGYQYTFGAAVGGGSYVITVPSGTEVPESAATKYSGNNSIQYEYKLSRGQGVSIELDVFHNTPGTMLDISQYTYLCFWILGTEVGQLMRVGCQSGPDNTTEVSNRVVLDAYVDDDGTGEGVSDTVWRGVNVPTALLLTGGSSYDYQNVDRVTFMLLRDEIPKNEQGTLWIDHVYFSDTLLPVRIVGLAGNWRAGGVHLSWQDLREGLHVGFHVYRQEGTPESRTRLKDSLIAEENGTYTVLDRSADPTKSHLYTIVAVEPAGTEVICDTLRISPPKR